MQSLQALRTIATATALMAPFIVTTSVFAADEKAATVEEPKVVLGPAPTDFGLKLTDYYDDCQKVNETITNSSLLVVMYAQSESICSLFQLHFQNCLLTLLPYGSL